ncbi:hypothetical protein GW846_01030 [Candidatus Gracilibacteria bacterium]|nr:hypothetical protein [Candidatus Gracilibacteria bacterium]
MIEVSYKNADTIAIKNADKKEILFNFSDKTVHMEDYDVTHPGEYEKSGNLLEVKEYTDLLFYKFLIDGKHMCIVTSDSFELKEEIVGFFGDVDILIIIGTKDAVKIFENIEAKLVIPYGEGKDLFLHTLGQHSEAIKVSKIGSDLSGDRTEFVNLED